jgi:uncharacterized protein YjbI with pentapeptide repeats
LIIIKHRFSRAVLFTSERSDLVGQDLRAVDFTFADLRGLNLEGAALRGGRLSHADLSEANLTCARLQGADISGSRWRQTIIRRIELDGATNATDSDIGQSSGPSWW